MSSWNTNVSYIADWLDSLDDRTITLVVAAIELLAEEGPNLRRPVVGEITGSRFKNMKELRPGSSGPSEIRILFVFDPNREAIMLLAGDKQKHWNEWYKKAIPEADRIFQRYLDGLSKEK